MSSPTDLEQLSGQLVQVLENFRRCGLTRVGKLDSEALPEGIHAAVRALLEPGSGPPGVAAGPPNRNQPASAAEPISVAGPVGGATPARAAEPAAGVAGSSAAPSSGAGGPSGTTPSPANATTAAASESSSQPSVWALPVLELPERQLRMGELNGQVQACRECTEIVSFRQQTVFGTGTLKPRVCFIGEAPGADEDRAGVPFVGRAGQLLTKIIDAMKLSREEVYILNALKCRPPQNRTPIPTEIDSCRHFLQSQLEVLQPEFIVCLGAVAVRAVLNDSSSIGRMRGRFHYYRGAKVVVTYHPSYLLRQESAKRMVWDDMKMLLAEMHP